MQIFRVALLQLVTEETRQANLNKGLDYCRKAKALGANLALFPEMWSNGYAVTNDAGRLRRDMVGADSPFVRAFQKEAKTLDMAVGIISPKRTKGAQRSFSGTERAAGKADEDNASGCPFSLDKPRSPLSA